VWKLKSLFIAIGKGMKYHRLQCLPYLNEERSSANDKTYISERMVLINYAILPSSRDMPYSVSHFNVLSNCLIKLSKVKSVEWHLRSFRVIFTMKTKWPGAQVTIVSLLQYYCPGCSQFQKHGFTCNFKVIPQYCIAYPYCAWFSRH